MEILSYREFNKLNDGERRIELNKYLGVYNNKEIAAKWKLGNTSYFKMKKELGATEEISDWRKVAKLAKKKEATELKEIPSFKDFKKFTTEEKVDFFNSCRKSNIDLGDLAAEWGIKKPSIYYHYTSAYKRYAKKSQDDAMNKNGKKIEVVQQSIDNFLDLQQDVDTQISTKEDSQLVSGNNENNMQDRVQLVANGVYGKETVKAYLSVAKELIADDKKYSLTLTLKEVM